MRSVAPFLNRTPESDILSKASLVFQLLLVACMCSTVALGSARDPRLVVRLRIPRPATPSSSDSYPLSSSASSSTETSHSVTSGSTTLSARRCMGDGFSPCLRWVISGHKWCEKHRGAFVPCFQNPENFAHESVLFTVNIDRIIALPPYKEQPLPPRTSSPRLNHNAERTDSFYLIVSRRHRRSEEGLDLFEGRSRGS